MAETSIRTFRRSFKYRLYPSKRQQAVLSTFLDAARNLYNAALEQRITAWKSRKISLNYFDQCSQLKEARDSGGDLSLLGYTACQATLRRLQRTFDAFFRRIKTGETPGYPRFKGRDRFNSITFPAYGDGVRLLDKKLRVRNVGMIRVRLHRPVKGRIKTVALKHEAGKWFVIFSCDQILAREYPEATAEVGIDMGLESFATLSTGEKIENPRWYRKAEKRLTEAHRSLSRKKKDSNRRHKAKQRLARLHVKVANQRKDFQHNLAHRIVSENALITVENLEPKKMSERSPKGLSKSIRDAAWTWFFIFLAYKAEEAGRRFAKVPPFNTSKLTFCCGELVNLSLSDRVIRCPRCRSVKDRDWNAALNILRLGRSLQASA